MLCFHFIGRTIFHLNLTTFYWVYMCLGFLVGFLGCTSSEESSCQCRRHNETWVQSLGWEDPLEEGMATHCSILAWRIPWTKEPGGLQSMGSQRVGQDWSDLAQKHIQGQNKNYSTLKEPGKCNLLSKRKKIGKKKNKIGKMMFVRYPRCWIIRSRL